MPEDGLIYDIAELFKVFADSTRMKIMPAKIKLNVIHHIIYKFKSFANIQKSASLFLSFEKNTNFAHYFGNIM